MKNACGSRIRTVRVHEDGSRGCLAIDREAIHASGLRYVLVNVPAGKTEPLPIHRQYAMKLSGITIAQVPLL